MTNETQLLYALARGAQVKQDFQPQNNKQAYLAYLNGLDISLPEPRTTEEVLLYNLCLNGGGTGGGSLKIRNAAYFFYQGNRLDQKDELFKVVSGATDMSYMFASSGLTSLDMSEIDTSNATSMEGIFDDCGSLMELTNFSAVKLPEWTDFYFPEAEKGKCVLRKLTLRTDLPDGEISVKFPIMLVGAPMSRLAMVEFFESLPDVSKIEGSKAWATIYIVQTSAVTGNMDVQAGSYDKPIATIEELEYVINYYCLGEVVCYATHPNSQEKRIGRGYDALNRASYGDLLFPILKLRWVDQSGIVCDTLTKEDREIAINKGWIIEEG